MPSLYDPSSVSNTLPLSIARGAVARHQVIDNLVELLPRRLAIGMAADDKRRASVKFLVLQVSASEFRTDHIPREFEQLHARHSVRLRSLEVGPELLREVWVRKDRDICWELEHAPTAEFAELIDKHRVVLRTPFERCVHHASITTDIPFRPAFIGVDLPMDHAGDGAFDRCHFAKHFPHAWHLVSTGGVGDLA